MTAINIGKKWTYGEEQLLLQLYNEDELDINDIAKVLKRTPGGIAARLVANKVIEDQRQARGYSKSRTRDERKEITPIINTPTITNTSQLDIAFMKLEINKLKATIIKLNTTIDKLVAEKTNIYADKGH